MDGDQSATIKFRTVAFVAGEQRCEVPFVREPPLPIYGYLTSYGRKERETRPVMFSTPIGRLMAL
jgi:hypothetical protein